MDESQDQGASQDRATGGAGVEGSPAGGAGVEGSPAGGAGVEGARAGDGAGEAAAPMQAPSRDEGPQYALPLVVRVERGAAPARTDALEGAGRAVLAFLSDPRVTEPEGEWAAATRAWQDARIRKVVRRARGAAWERAGALPGITVVRGSAEV